MSVVKQDSNNYYNYFVVRDEWRTVEPIPPRVEKIIRLDFLNNENKQVYYDVFILEEAQHVLTEEQILEEIKLLRSLQDFNCQIIYDKNN